MSTFATEIQTEVGLILDEFGITATVYLSPTYTLNSEGDISTISKGTGTSAKALVFSPDESVFTRQIEGIDTVGKFRCFLKSSVGTLDLQDIIQFPATTGTYYKIVEIRTYPLQAQNVTYYDLDIEKIQKQSWVS